MKALVGYTGFVGSNIGEQAHFDDLYNSKNIPEISKHKYDLVVYSGIRAEKFLANTNPDADFEHIQKSLDTIASISCKRLVLISTVDVYGASAVGDEEHMPDLESLQPYGKHRRWLELAVLQQHPGAMVIRLPALFGNRLKKNFLYDMVTIIPSMLRPQKVADIQPDCPLILTDYYELKDNGFYGLRALCAGDRAELYSFFRGYHFNALSFTDSRNSYQFYGLSHLWRDIELAMASEIRTLNISTEPLPVSEIYQAVYDLPFVNELSNSPMSYDIRSLHADLWGGHDGYMQNRDAVLREIVSFVKGWH